ncbi:MAG: cold shock domain-containing protein [Pirellulales bacterium]|nr:cold shock domain-containing protein [Pirellulales bacterium]
MAAMPQGVIKKLVADRGFGFISADGSDIFFHHSSVKDNGFDDLQEGQTVEYELEEESGGSRGRGKGPRAASVARV